MCYFSELFGFFSSWFVVSIYDDMLFWAITQICLDGQCFTFICVNTIFNSAYSSANTVTLVGSFFIASTGCLAPWVETVSSAYSYHSYGLIDFIPVFVAHFECLQQGPYLTYVRPGLNSLLFFDAVTPDSFNTACNLT